MSFSVNNDLNLCPFLLWSIISNCTCNISSNKSYRILSCFREICQITGRADCMYLHACRTQCVCMCVSPLRADAIMLVLCVDVLMKPVMLWGDLLMLLPMCVCVCVCVCLNESEHFYLNDDILMTCCCKRAHENECVCVCVCRSARLS